MKKIDRNMVRNWNKEWTWVKYDDILDHFLSMLNSESYGTEDGFNWLRKEILEYNKEN